MNQADDGPPPLDDEPPDLAPVVQFRAPAGLTPLDLNNPEVALLAAILGDPTGGTWQKYCTLPIDALTDKEVIGIWRRLASGTPIDDPGAMLGDCGLTVQRYVEWTGADTMGTLGSLHYSHVLSHWRHRRIGELALQMSRDATTPLEQWTAQLEAISRVSEFGSRRLRAIPITGFTVPRADDRSVLLGNRFLNRGDGGIIVSSSGVGKSSIYIQAAILWALGRPFFGIKPNGCLRSLLMQSEDSEGDVAEVVTSIVLGLKLTPAEIQAVGERVVLVTDRSHRGPGFLAECKVQIARHTPDLVWINPLVAFLEGDMKEAGDVGRFLREGLNGLNSDAGFGWIVVHHTTKPPQDKGKTERNWSEVMYDMAGSYDLIGWARFIISLRPTETQGQFNMVLAKRGTRAGVTRRVEAGAVWRDEIVTTIPLRWSDEDLVLENGDKIRSLMWHPREWQGPAESKPGAKAGARKYVFGQFHEIFPRDPTKPASSSILLRLATEMDPEMSKATFYRLLTEWGEQGVIVRVVNGYGLRYYRKLSP